MMWLGLLRGREFEGLKFIGQKPIDRFIVDFYCAELMLAIEIDGDTCTPTGI
jgi:very-short-patch-repair endonuclease